MKLRQTLFSIWISILLAAANFAVASDAHHATGAPPREVLQSLLEGNRRYVDGRPRHLLEDAVRRKALTKGQQPSAIILSCSDSRVPPELIFDKGLGELFVIRVAGNVLGAATVASIEYAVEHLGSSLIVVMGHESCGAVKAALTTPKTQSTGSLDLDSLIGTIQPGIANSDASLLSKDPTLRKPVMENVDAVSENLMKRSRIVRKMVEEGKVSIVRAIYGLESGKVEFWKTEALPGVPIPAMQAGQGAAPEMGKNDSQGVQPNGGVTHGL